MRHFGPVLSVLIVLSLVVAACASDGEPVDPTAPTTAPTDTAVVTSAPPGTPSLTLGELRQKAFDGDGFDEVDVAISQFALDFGPIDGAVAVSFDGTLPTTGTDTMTEILRVWDRLTADQQTQVVETIDRLEAASTFIGSVDGTDQSATEPRAATAAVEGPGARDATLAVFARRAEAPFSDDEALAIARDAAAWLVGKLGGSLNFDLSSAPISEADRRSIDAATFTLLLPGVGDVRIGTDADNVRECTIVLYTQDHMTGPRLRSVIAHEAFHCWTSINGAERTSFLEFPGWLNEGLSTWVGEQYAGSSFGNRWWRGFFEPETFTLFRATYEAFGFVSEIAQLQGGDEQLWAMIPDIVAAGPGGDAATFAAMTDGLAPEEVAVLASTTAREPGWGPGWDLTGVRITGNARYVLDHRVSDTSGRKVPAAPGEQRLVRITLQRPSPDGGPWVVGYDATGLTNNRWADGTEFVTTTATTVSWCLDGSCECPDGSFPAGDLEPTPSNSDELFVSLTGTGTTGAAVAMTIASLDDLCDDEEAPSTGAGLQGTWKASGTGLTAMFSSVFVDLFPGDGADMGIQAVAGDVTMTLGTGSGELVYDNVRIFFEPGAALDELTLNGRGTFTWTIAKGFLLFEGSTFEMVASSTALGEFPLEIPETSDLPGGPATFAFSPPTSELILSAVGASSGTVWFPTVWLRQD